MSLYRSSLWAAAAGALLLSGSALASTPRAAAEPGPSAFALPLADLGVPATEAAVSDQVPDALAAATASCDGGASVSIALARAPRLESIRYRPRPRYRGRERERDYGESHRSNGFSQIHSGFFDPDGNPSSGILFGFRAGGAIDDHIQLGLGLDWNHRSDNTSAVVREVPLPGGGTAERRQELARSSTNLLPMMAFLQVSPGADLPFQPYFGVGGGYEVLFLSADDFQTGTEFDATYGGWGWQAWGGVALPLSGRSRIGAEVFTNTSELSRDVDDPSGTFREVVKMDGIGMRAGLSWGF